MFLVNGCGNLTDEQIIKDPAKAMSTCSKSISNQNECYIRISKVLSDNSDLAFQACSAINEQEKDPQHSLMGKCILDLLAAQNNSDVKLSICKKIEEKDWKKMCIEQVANEEKNQSKAVEICNEITDDNNLREHCYGGVLTNFQNVSVDIKLAMCALKTGMDKDNCYRNVAEELLAINTSRSMEICNKISDKNTKDACLNNFLSSPELVKINPSLAVSICDSLTLKSRCYNDVARALSGSDPKQAVEICKKLGDDVQISDCYGNVWFYSNTLVVENYNFTITMCNILTLKKDDCLRRIVSVFIDIDRTRAAEVCRLMSASSSNGCLQEVNRG
jgi:hypothetical protein